MGTVSFIVCPCGRRSRSVGIASGPALRKMGCCGSKKKAGAESTTGTAPSKPAPVSSPAPAPAEPAAPAEPPGPPVENKSNLHAGMTMNPVGKLLTEEEHAATHMSMTDATTAGTAGAGENAVLNTLDESRMAQTATQIKFDSSYDAIQIPKRVAPPGGFPPPQAEI